jgi:hypothetical protein
VEVKQLVIFLKTLDFGAMSLIQCMLIPDLRKRILLRISKGIQICRSVKVRAA